MKPDAHVADGSNPDAIITVEDVMCRGVDVPTASEMEVAKGPFAAARESIRMRRRTARATAIVKAAFTGKAAYEGPDRRKLAVAANVRADGALTVWLMRPNWTAIMITSTRSRIHIVEDQRARMEAAVPSRLLGEVVAKMASPDHAGGLMTTQDGWT